jgi:DNA-binding NtrC family response regulator
MEHADAVTVEPFKSSSRQGGVAYELSKGQISRNKTMERWNFGMKMKQTDSLKILVVDDEDIVRLTLTAMIDHMGHSAKCVNDGLAGKQTLNDNKYDAAFVDMRMPGLDGMNLLKWSRQKRLGLPIIIMSGHGAEASRDEALQSGAFAFLSKPFSLVGIKGLIEKIKESPRPT